MTVIELNIKLRTKPPNRDLYFMSKRQSPKNSVGFQRVPDLLSGALRQLQPEIAPDFAKFTRLETYGKEMELFR